MPAPPRSRPPARRHARLLAALAVAVALAGALALAPPAAAQGRTATVSASADALTGPYPDGQSLAASVHLPRTGGWARFDGALASRFGERAAVGGVAVGHDLADRWVGVVSAGGSTAAFALPAAELSAAVARKWGRDRQIMTTAGAASRWIRDGHHDVDLTAEVAAYGDGVLVQAGGRLTRSEPGRALGGGGHVAVTVGRAGRRQVAARLSVAHEAYALAVPTATGPAYTDVAFRSATGGISWHEPLTDRWGARLSAGIYVSPHYQQVSVGTGVARTF